MATQIEKIPFKIKIFMLSLLIPTEYSFLFLGLRLSFYRMLLLLFLFPVISGFFGATKKHATDKYVFLLSFWILCSMVYNHGEDGIKSGGIMVIETLIPYLLARVYIINSQILVSVVRFYLFLIFLCLLLTIPENLFGNNLLRGYRFMGSEERLGLYRAFGPFDHPILLAVFCGLGLGLSKIIYSKGVIKQVFIALASISALSSIAFIMVAFQLLFLYIRKIRELSFKTYGILFAIAYVVVDIISNRSPLNVFLSYLTLNPQTGYFRKMIWDYGLNNVFDNLFFGLGLNDWVRPEWMPPSVDSFWLLMTMRHGIPALLCLFMIMYYCIKRNRKGSENIIEYVKYFSLFSLTVSIAGLTVHFWNSAYVFIFFMIGANINLYLIDDEESNEIIDNNY